MDFKIVFIAYNRPQYFSQTLGSIKDQIMGMDVHLILDGPKERHKQHLGISGYEDDLKKVMETERLFREAFKSYPDIDKRVHREEKNIGCQRNILKAYKFGFEDLDAKYVLFLPEDGFYSPLFIEQLNIISEFCKDDPEIVQMGCGGFTTRDWPPGVLDELCCKIVEPIYQGDSVWKREAYEIVRPHLEVFSDLLLNTLSDPRMEYEEGWQKFCNALIVYTKSLGFMDYGQLGAGGEDSFIVPILAMHGKLRVSTAGEYLYNIGIVGEHSFRVEDHTAYMKNFYPKIARELYIDKQYRGFQLQRIWGISENWREQSTKIIEMTPPY